MEPEAIVIKGARVHNLDNLYLEIPKKKLVVFTGPSGSGKSSLAFDTLFAEGQRRYVESLSAYARQFLGQMDKPDYDYIRGLSPTISIEQKAASNNPRSTVGTITEITDYLRVLWARIGRQTCHRCGRPVGRMDSSSIVKSILRLESGTRCLLLAPIVQNRKGEYRDLFQNLRREGFSRLRLDGKIVDLSSVEMVDRNQRHTIDVLIDRLIIRDDLESRLSDSVETALKVADGRCVLSVITQDGPRPDIFYSEKLACDHCEISFPQLSPQSFSFNNPLGMCQACNGLGSALQMDPAKVADPSLSLEDGAIRIWSRRFTRTQRLNWRTLEALVAHYGRRMNQPFSTYPLELRQTILYGNVDTPIELLLEGRKRSLKVAFEGALPYLMRRFNEAENENNQEALAYYLSEAPCEACQGTRLRPESRAVLIGKESIAEVSRMTIRRAQEFFEQLPLEGSEAVIASELLKEITNRLRFLNNVGLNYLDLSRAGPSLSGGEAQRIRLASQLGSELTGVLYILDEPSIGLHQRDNRRLLATLKHLRDLGNTVIVVEHDRETMEESDWLIDFGPGAGVHGGRIVATGTPDSVRNSPNSLTGRYLREELTIETPTKRRRPQNGSLVVRGARMNNLKNIDATFPLGLFTVVTGVSGAGKSTLVNEILFPAMARRLYKSIATVGEHDSLVGGEKIDKVIEIDQGPIGRTPRSNPATYTKTFDPIRSLFAKLPESLMYGFQPGRFSFNVKGGRCEACQGAGVRKIEMHFLADVYVTCEQCCGKRFNPATLRVKYRGHSISDVLDMTVAEAAELFKPHRAIHRILSTLLDVGLGYLPLGQPSPTLSGGEAQRIKLSRELAKVATGDTLYILDEPSTGLHFDDIKKLMHVIQTLVEAGNTVVMIEHNLDIIKTADYIIDLGPEGGSDGGRIIACGTPEEVSREPNSFTGRFLGKLL